MNAKLTHRVTREKREQRDCPLHMNYKADASVLLNFKTLSKAM